MSAPTVTQSEIVTPRLRLRRLHPRDAGLIALYAGDARVARATSVIPHPYPPGAAEAFVARVLGQGAREMVWALDTGPDGGNGLIGLISLKPRGEGLAEIGSWVAPAFWGTGFAREAVEALVADGAGGRTLVAEVFQDNPASARVLMHAGFTYEGDGEVHSLARAGMVPTFRYRRAPGDRV